MELNSQSLGTIQGSLTSNHKKNSISKHRPAKSLKTVGGAIFHESSDIDGYQGAPQVEPMSSMCAQQTGRTCHSQNFLLGLISLRKRGKRPHKDSITSEITKLIWNGTTTHKDGNACALAQLQRKGRKPNSYVAKAATPATFTGHCRSDGHSDAMSQTGMRIASRDRQPIETGADSCPSPPG